MKTEMKKVKAEIYECLARQRDKVKYEYHLRKNTNYCRQQVKGSVKRSDDVCMSLLARIKYTEEDHDQSNVVCEEINSQLKVTSQPVVTIWKIIQKQGSGKGGYYTWPIWMVQVILEQLVNGTPPAATSLKIASRSALFMTGVKFIVQELPIIKFIWSCRTILRIIGKNLAAYCIRKVDKWDKLFSTGTGRHQTALWNFFIRVIDEERPSTLILST